MSRVNRWVWQGATYRDLYGFQLRQLRGDRRGGWVENLAWIALVLGVSLATVTALGVNINRIGGIINTALDKIK